MNNITDMPERIWASVCARKIWESEDEKLDADVEYVRGDLERELVEAASKARLALAGYISTSEAINVLDEVLGKHGHGHVGEDRG